MKLANEFSRLLTEQLGEEIIAGINWLNETGPEHICASHNFCDANEVMYEAFQNVFGEEADVHSYESID